MYKHTNNGNSVIRESKGVLGKASVRSEQPDSPCCCFPLHTALVLNSPPQKTTRVISTFQSNLKQMLPSQPEAFSSELQTFQDDDRESEKEHPNLVKTCQVWIKQGKILVWRWCCTLLKLPPTHIKAIQLDSLFPNISNITGRNIYRM